jgi:hypothetical protein
MEAHSSIRLPRVVSVLAHLGDEAQVVRAAGADPFLEMILDLFAQRRPQQGLFDLHFEKMPVVALWAFNPDLGSTFHVFPPLCDQT